MSAVEVTTNIFNLILICLFIPYLYNKKMLGQFLAASIIYIWLSGVILSIPAILIGKLLIHLGMSQRFELIANISTAPIFIFILLYLYVKLSDEYDYNDTTFNKMTDEIHARIAFTKSLIHEVFFDKEMNYESHETELEELAEKMRVNIEQLFFKILIAVIGTPILLSIISNYHFSSLNLFIYLDESLGNYKYVLVTLIHLLIIKRYHSYIDNKIFQRIKNKLEHLKMDGKYAFFETSDDWFWGQDPTKIHFKLTNVNCESKFQDSDSSYFLFFENGNIFYYFHPKIDYHHFINIIKKISQFGSLKKFHDASSR